MLDRDTVNTPTPPTRPVAAGGRFARDPGEYATSRARLRLVNDNTTVGADGQEVR